MNLRRVVVLPSVALVTAVLALFASAGALLADQPVNASFETGDTSGWSETLNGGVIKVAELPHLLPPPGTGDFTAQLLAGDADVPVSLSQTVNLSVGQTVSGWMRFIAEENCLQERDLGLANDYFSVTVTAPSTVETVLISGDACTGDVPWTEWTFRASQAGPHTITASITNDKDSAVSSGLFLDADVGPHWEVVAKVGGGNVLNENLPDYVPGTWAQKNVVVYLKCVPGESPIALKRATNSVFRDGEGYYSSKPTDLCRDANGREAPPIVDWGPIKVDTVAPVCKVLPAVQYVPRKTQQLVHFDFDFRDSGSGLHEIGIVYSSISGGAVLNGGGFDPAFPPGYVDVDVTMGASTAGKVEYGLALWDHADNRSDCKFTIKAR